MFRPSLSLLHSGVVVVPQFVQEMNISSPVAVCSCPEASGDVPASPCAPDTAPPGAKLDGAAPGLVLAACEAALCADFDTATRLL